MATVVTETSRAAAIPACLFAWLLPGAGHLYPGHPVGQLQVGDHGLGDRPRRRLGRLGQHQGHVGGPVAVLGQPRPLA